MKKFIKWHKLKIGKIQNLLRIDNYETLWLSWLKGLITGIIIMSLLSGCYIYEGSYYSDDIYESSYTSVNHDLYYWNGNIYYGYYSGFYYYYGIPNYYPWWYNYSYQPAFNYYVHTHIYIQCDNGYYVYGHRGKKFNNKKSKNFKPQNVLVKSNKINSKTNPKNNNYIRSNNTNINKINTNKPNNNKININKSNNNKINNNKSNNKKININKSNKNNNIRNNNSSRPTYNKSNTTKSNKSNRSNNRKPK